MKNIVLASFAGENLVILLTILAFLGVLVLAIILVKKYVTPLQIHKDEIDEETAVKEELDRVLVPIDDEDVQKQMDEDMRKNGK